MKQVRSLVVLATLCCIGLPVLAQQKPPEEPGWAKGRPKSDTAMAMAPVPAFPIPTAPDKLPTSKFKLPPGFKVETWASGVLDARGLREGAKGNIFVSSLFVANKVYVIPEKGSPAQGHHRQDADGHRHRVPQREPVRCDEHEDHAVR